LGKKRNQSILQGEPGGEAEEILRDMPSAIASDPKNSIAALKKAALRS
jgi:hypothetical protein